SPPSICMTQTRSFEWIDPAAVASTSRSQSGLDFLRSITGRERVQAAPIAQCLDFHLVEVDSARVVFNLVPPPFHSHPPHTPPLRPLHGAVIGPPGDAAASAAVRAPAPAGPVYDALEVKVTFVRAATVATGVLRCEGTVLPRGSRVATPEARLTDAAGKLYAH